jgi:hypothetical protein
VHFGITLQELAAKANSGLQPIIKEEECKLTIKRKHNL